MKLDFPQVNRGEFNPVPRVVCKLRTMPQAAQAHVIRAVRQRGTGSPRMRYHARAAIHVLRNVGWFNRFKAKAAKQLSLGI